MSAEQPEAALIVHTQARYGGGAPPAPALPPPPSSAQPIPGLAVEVRRSDGTPSPVVQQATDAQGQAAFSLPAGRYWVYVPRDANPPGFSLDGSIVTALPDGEPVRAWAEATVPESGTVSVTVTVVFALP